MTQDEALKLALETLEEFGEHYDWCHQFPTYAFPENYPPCNCGYDEAINAIKEALAQPEQEPIKITHKHEWFRTGEMKVGQMRCISCGTWGQEEMPQRTWVGLTDEDDIDWDGTGNLKQLVEAVEAKLKEKNNG